MKIADYLTMQDVLPDLAANDLRGVLEELSEHLAEVNKLKDPSILVDTLIEREKLGSTGIGNGVAIPHGRMAGLENILMVFGRSTKGIDFDAHDGHPVHLFFLLVAPEDSAGDHLKALARISRVVKSQDCRDKLGNANGREKLFETITEEDSRQ